MSRTKHPWHSGHAAGSNIPKKQFMYMKGHSNPNGGCTIRYNYKDDASSYKNNRPEQSCESSRQHIMKKYFKRKVRYGINHDTMKKILEIYE